MTLYLFNTIERVQHTRELDIDLSVDMGPSSDRITDRMAKTAAENRALTDLLPTEEIVSVFREDGTQVWPRKRTKKTGATAARENVGVITTVHNEEEE